MLFVLPAVVFWGLFALAVWFFFFRKTIRHEKTIADAKKRSTQFERLLAKSDEPLHCLGCHVTFPGPLNDHGCPQCQTQAFVIPVQTSDDPQVLAAPVMSAAAAAPIPEKAAPPLKIGFRQ